MSVIVAQRCDFPGADLLDLTVEASDGEPVVEHEHRRSHVQGIAVANRSGLAPGDDAIEVPRMEVHDAPSIWRAGSVVAGGEQIPDGLGLQLPIDRDDGIDVRVQVEQDLTATTTRRHHTALPVAHCHDRHQGFGARPCRRAYGYQLRARASREVEDVHPCMDVAVDIHRSRSNCVGLSGR
jgi:hypothetical protein